MKNAGISMFNVETFKILYNKKNNTNEYVVLVHFKTIQLWLNETIT